MANAVLTDEEKARIRYHLGYPQTDPVSSIQLGSPAFGQPLFMVESAMERIPVAVIGIIRQLVQVLDHMEARIIEAPDFLVVSAAGEVDINKDYIEQLRTEYARWAQKLADNLGAPINQFFQGSVNSINIRVMH
jgi:hypothetical protein